jgi:hypothetical protein
LRRLDRLAAQLRIRQRCATTHLEYHTWESDPESSPRARHSSCNAAPWNNYER